jgi:hypothetical protein
VRLFLNAGPGESLGQETLAPYATRPMKVPGRIFLAEHLHFCTARPSRLTAMLLLLLGSAACSKIYDVPRSAGSAEISLLIQAESTAVWNRRAIYSVRAYRYECGHQVRDQLPPGKRDGQGLASRAPDGTVAGASRRDREPPILHATWPCSGALFTEAQVRVVFLAKRLAARRYDFNGVLRRPDLPAVDPLEVVSVSVPPPSRCDFKGPRFVNEGDVIRCDIRADPDRSSPQGPQSITLVMARLQNASLGLCLTATPDVTSWIDGRLAGSAPSATVTLGLEHSGI